MFKILNKIKYLHLLQKRQRGAALMVMLVILILGASAMLLNSLSSTTLHIERDKITADSLAQAKEAIIGYAAKADTPGQFPCPEDTSLIGLATEGTAKNSCTLPAIGRLPWRQLGLGPLRDGNSELLWYALSPGFRTSPINSNTPAQLTVDGAANNAVAIIFSAGPPINGQARPTPTSSTPPDTAQYLELSNNDGDNTFISSQSGDTFNDRLLLVTANDLFRVVEKRVAKEVINELNKYYCGDLNVNPAGGCIAAGVNRHYPRPANFADSTCLGNGNLTGICVSDNTINNGRIPATPATAWSISSPLRGTNTSNWFRNNAWREVIFYAVANACSDGTTNCNGTGFLTLNDVPGNHKVIVIATGSALAGQARSSPNTLGNYLEGENLAPLDDIFTKNGTLPFNDIAVNIP